MNTLIRRIRSATLVLWTMCALAFGTLAIHRSYLYVCDCSDNCGCQGSCRCGPAGRCKGDGCKCLTLTPNCCKE